MTWLRRNRGIPMKELARHVATRAVRQTSIDMTMQTVCMTTTAMAMRTIREEPRDMTMQTMYDYYSHGYADYVYGKCL
jgi:hypothetical protein